MLQIIGIALWGLLPGFIAKKKGRSFWGWYFLSFLISPIFTALITLCLSNKSLKNEAELSSNDTQTSKFCRKCGEPLVDGSKFCRKCGTGVLEQELINSPNTEEYKVVILDTVAKRTLIQMRKVDILKFPPEKFSNDGTYYAVETIKEGKKVRIYCTKEKWENQLKINESVEV